MAAGTTTRGRRVRRAVRASTLPAVVHPPKGADATREKLLQATHELLFERAGAEPSVSQICDRAGVQVAMVSYCFGGKAQLLEALVDRVTEGIKAELEQLAALELEPEQMLRRHVAAVVRNFLRYPYVSQLNERIRAGQAFAEQITTLFAGPMIAFYRDLLAEGAGRGEFREVDPTLFFFSTVGMCEYLFAARSLLSGSGEALDDELIDRFTEHTIELLLHGISRRPSGKR
jgi:AcrR family transcriptional regulator